MNPINEERQGLANGKVADDELRLALQREVVAGLEESGDPTGKATALLAPIERLLGVERKHRHRLQADCRKQADRPAQRAREYVRAVLVDRTRRPYIRGVQVSVGLL